MLIAGGNPYLAAGAALLSVPLAVLFNLALIPSFGAIGASIALVLAALLNAAIGGVLVCMRLRALIELSTLVRGALATALIALLSPLFTWAGPWLLLKLSLLLIVYAFILLAFGELKWEELKFFGGHSVEREDWGFRRNESRAETATAAWFRLTNPNDCCLSTLHSRAK